MEITGLWCLRGTDLDAGSTSPMKWELRQKSESVNGGDDETFTGVLGRPSETLHVKYLEHRTVPIKKYLLSSTNKSNIFAGVWQFKA